MALTETRPETASSSTDSAPKTVQRRSSIEEVLGSGDHKTMGRVLIGGGVLGLLAGLVLEVVALAAVNDFLDLSSDGANRLAQLWSLSRDLITFGGLVPILVGLGIYLVPLQIGAPSLVFPRGAAAATWTWCLGTLFVVLAYLNNGGPGGGRRDFVVLWAAALAMMIGALLWLLVCLATSILGARTQGMSLDRAPATTWAFLMFAIFGLMQLPITMAELLMSFIRIRYELLPIEASAELTGVLDGWMTGTSLYWFAIPVLGFALDMIGVHTSVPILRHRAGLIAISVFALTTFGLDLSGMATLRDSTQLGFAVPLLLIAPLVILGVLGVGGDSLRTGTFAPRVALVGALLTGLLLLLASTVALLGIVEPVMQALDELFPGSVDLTNTLILEGTRFQEGLALLVVGAVAVGIIAALHHWSAKIWGRHLAEPLGLLAILATAGGAVIAAAGEVLAGIADEPALPAPVTEDFAAGLGTISMLGAAVLAAGILIAGLNLVLSLITGKSVSSDDGWSGMTLEWATDSPPPTGNFPAPPIVRSATPLADGELRYVGIDQAEEG